MKIQFKEDVELEIVENYDEESDVANVVNEIFYNGEIFDVSLLNETEGYYHIQFGDGSCCFNLPKDSIEKIEFNYYENDTKN